MLVLPELFWHLKAVQVWWPQRVEDVYALLPTAQVVTVKSAPDVLGEQLEPYAFVLKRYYNLLLDLSVSEAELWLRLHKTTRQCLRQARKLEHRILVNQETEAAFLLINDTIRRKKYAPPVSRETWKQTLEHSEVFVVTHGDAIVATQVDLVDPSGRARRLIAATGDRTDPRRRQIVGNLNRLLLWYACGRHKVRGIRWYDLGGLVTDAASREYSVSQFKLSFGPVPVSECTVRIAADPCTRSILRGAVAARRALHVLGAAAFMTRRRGLSISGNPGGEVAPTAADGPSRTNVNASR